MTTDFQATADRLHADGQLAEAIEFYRRAVSAAPDRFEAWYGLGFALCTMEAFAEAAEVFRRATFLAPSDMPTRAKLAEALFAVGHVNAANTEYAKVAAGDDPALRAIAVANLACIAPNDPDLTNEDILAWRRLWIEQQSASIQRMPVRSDRRGGKIRIGYVGAFFGSANWMKGYMGVINAHDRDRFEINLIADRTLPAAAAGYRDHAEDRIWEVTDVSNSELAGFIAEAELDVLVDLNGYSHQPRLPLMLFRSAPVQLSWVGMYGTTGLTTLDGVVGDASVLPPEEERFYSEPVRRVRHTYLTFDMFYPVPAVAPPPWNAQGVVTFGSLASAYKITDAVIAAWSRILLGVPGSRLLLRNRTLDNSANRAELSGRFHACGIGTDRLILEGGAEHFEYLRTYDRIDIALDTFPYNGGTTTAEALWQGMPLLTFNGDRWAGRTSRSILNAAGLEEWVAADEAGYVEMAIVMGRRPGLLAERRDRQRARLAKTPAFDPASLCRELEELYSALLVARGLIEAD